MQNITNEMCNILIYSSRFVFLHLVLDVELRDLGTSDILARGVLNLHLALYIFRKNIRLFEPPEIPEVAPSVNAAN